MRAHAIMIFAIWGFCGEPPGQGTSVSATGADDESSEGGESKTGGESEAGGESEVGDESEAGDGTESSGAISYDSGWPTVGDEAPPNPHCFGDAIVDNLEHGSTLIPVTAGRQGAWYTYNDGSPGATQQPSPIEDPFLPTNATAAVGIYAARTSGEGFGDWGAGFGFDVNNQGCEADEHGDPIDPACSPSGIRRTYDVSGWTGISFYARSVAGTDVSVDFKVPTEHETPIADGGTCDGTVCSDAYFIRVTFESEWSLFEISFEDLAQAGFGESFAFDPTAVFGMQWQIPAGASFDIAVDEICFY